MNGSFKLNLVNYGENAEQVMAAYCEKLLAHLEDLEDAKLIEERASGPFVEVNFVEVDIDDL